MALKSTIEWTDATWNPLRGCTKISPGCKHCYAETFAERFRGVRGHPYEQGFDLRTVPEKLTEPLRWPSPRMVFVNSMSDLFHEKVSAAYIAAVCKVMDVANWHTYQVLTKRAPRMRDMLNGELSFAAKLRHIWWGVSIENAAHGLPRLDDLKATRANVKFVSIEPLLEDIPQIDLTGVDWAIVGGESGPGARPMHDQWVQAILTRCQESNVMFFFKQWGGVHKGRTGRLLNGRTYDAMPTKSTNPIPDRKTRVRLAEALELGILPVVSGIL